MSEEYDIIIIGSGPAGMSAAIYAGRGGYRTLIIEKMSPGGQMMLTDEIENYPAFPNGITGFELQDKMFKQAKKFDAEFKTETVTKITRRVNNKFSINTENNEYKALSVVIASGAKSRLLGVKGEKELTSKGVSYCGTCDGPFYRGKKVIVAGGGDTAITEALFIAKFASKVSIIHRRDRFRAVKSLVDKAESKDNIEFIFNKVIKSINGENKVVSVTIEDVENNESSDIETDGVFIFIGLLPNSDYLDKKILDKGNYVITNEKMETSIEGLYAAGDIRSDTFRQVICAASDGAKAAHYAGEYIDEMKGEAYK